MTIEVGEYYLKWNDRKVDFDDLIEVYENSRWIPCSERLPEKPEFKEKGYLVQKDHVTEPFSAWWNGEYWTDIMDDEITGIVAWQPLPQPYRE